MDSIVKRCLSVPEHWVWYEHHEHKYYEGGKWLHEAAGEIQRLKLSLFNAERSNNTLADEIERLREALQPFACKCEGDWCEYLRFDHDKAKCEHYIARSAIEEKE